LSKSKVGRKNRICTLEMIKAPSELLWAKSEMQLHLLKTLQKSYQMFFAFAQEPLEPKAPWQNSFQTHPNSLIMKTNV